MKYLVGVDGGGTKTEVVVCDIQGNIVSRVKGGSSNPNDVGKEKMLKTVAELLERAIPKDCNLADIGLGISGLFTSGCEEFLTDGIKSEIKVAEKVKAYSDKDSALNSAFDQDGCIVIIGTGSVAVVRKDGRITDIGGGGYLLDDALSGFDLGREALNAVLCANDGIGEKTLLTDLFNERTGENIRRHLKTVYLKGKAYVASFAPLVFTALSIGDKVADGIMKKCVRGFERLLTAVYKAWGKDKCEIAVFGGLTAKLDVITEYLSKEIREKIIIRLPEYPITYGLVKEFVTTDKKAFVKNFIKD